MADKELIFSFSYDGWPLAVTIEIISSKLVSGGDLDWIDWTGKFNKKPEYSLATRIHISQTKKKIRKVSVMNITAYIAERILF